MGDRCFGRIALICGNYYLFQARRQMNPMSLTPKRISLIRHLLKLSNLSGLSKHQDKHKLSYKLGRTKVGRLFWLTLPLTLPLSFFLALPLRVVAEPDVAGGVDRQAQEEAVRKDVLFEPETETNYPNGAIDANEIDTSKADNAIVPVNRNANPAEQTDGIDDRGDRTNREHGTANISNVSEQGTVEPNLDNDLDADLDADQNIIPHEHDLEHEAIEKPTVGEARNGKASDLLGNDATLINRPKPTNPNESEGSEDPESANQAAQDGNGAIEANRDRQDNQDPDAIKLDLSEFSGITEAKLNARQQKLIEADRLYRAGEIELAEQLYREAKTEKNSRLNQATASAKEANDSIATATKEPTQLIESDQANADHHLANSTNPDLATSVDSSESNVTAHLETNLEAETEPRTAAIYEITEAAPAAQVYWREYQAGMEQGLETRILVPLQLLTTRNPEFIPGHIAYAEALEMYDRPAEALAALEQACAIYPDEPKLMLARIRKLGESRAMAGVVDRRA
jgi:hypothetical protein